MFVSLYCLRYYDALRPTPAFQSRLINFCIDDATFTLSATVHISKYHQSRPDTQEGNIPRQFRIYRYDGKRASRFDESEFVSAATPIQCFQPDDADDSFGVAVKRDSRSLVDMPAMTMKSTV